MKKIFEMVKLGELDAAIDTTVKQLRDDPLNADVRAAYIELLCIRGDFEQADQQLDMMVRQHPDFLPGAVNLRQLIRAASARQDYYHGGATATLFAEPDAMFEAQLALRLAMTEKDVIGAAKAAALQEQRREPVAAMINGQHVNDIRDLDDSLGGYLELFGTDGKFYLVRFSEIELLTLQKPASLLDLIWRRSDIILKDGPQGEAFIPLSYIASQSAAERLGRDTDWQQHSDQLVTGVGQKMLLAGDNALPLTELRQFELVATPVQSAATADMQ